MHTRAVNAAAGVLLAAMEQGRQIPTSLAIALDSAGLLNSPEHAAEHERLLTERHETNEALSDIAVELRERETSPLTVYRASHDSIVMGLYTTAAEARKHCEAAVRSEHAETTTVKLWWREDEDTVDQPEDGEAELIEQVKSAVVPGPGLTRPTGYIVTPLEVASAFDPDADE
jgi:hypothetical protein